jgi:hypothetical protein
MWGGDNNVVGGGVNEWSNVLSIGGKFYTKEKA